MVGQAGTEYIVNQISKTAPITISHTDFLYNVPPVCDCEGFKVRNTTIYTVKVDIFA